MVKNSLAGEIFNRRGCRLAHDYLAGVSGAVLFVYGAYGGRYTMIDALLFGRLCRVVVVSYPVEYLHYASGWFFVARVASRRSGIVMIGLILIENDQLLLFIPTGAGRNVDELVDVGRVWQVHL